jgi:translation elongation factor EF-G
VEGFLEPLDDVPGASTSAAGGGVSSGSGDSNTPVFVFDNQMSGNAIPPEFYSAIEKGFREAANSGSLLGAPVEVHHSRDFAI